MKSLIFMGFILWLTAGAQAHEASLIEADTIPPKASEKISMIQEKPIANQEVSETADDLADDDFEQMNDFIRQENEKLKNIKLLNLDVEWANLKLKKKEIEQKIVQLDKAEGTGALPTLTPGVSDKPVIKLLGIFESDVFKKAVLNINGAKVNVQEGEQINGMLVKSITPQSVVLQSEDGQTQELRFL